MSLSMRVPIKAFEGLPKIQEPAESQQRGGGVLGRCRFQRACRWERSGPCPDPTHVGVTMEGGVSALSLSTRVPMGALGGLPQVQVTRESQYGGADKGVVAFHACTGGRARGPRLDLTHVGVAVESEGRIERCRFPRVYRRKRSRASPRSKSPPSHSRGGG